MKTLFLKVRSLISFKLEKSITLQAGDSIYFMGVCGTAMASLAVYLKKQGFVVSGSDENIYPPMSLVLQKEAVPVFKYSSDNIQNFIKLIVVGNVIGSSHIEIQRAKTLNIPVLSLPEFLQQSFLSYSKNIVAAGTHGKSTVTALMAHTAEETGQSPGFFIAGFPYNFDSSFRVSSKPNPYFVIEGDEYDTSFFAKRAKFFYYNPSYVILTGIEFDHGDIYKDLEDIQKSFSKFLAEIPSQGALAACIENPSVKKSLPFCKAPVLTYGINQGDFQIKSRKIIHNSQTKGLKEVSKKIQEIEVMGPNKKTYKISTSLLGWHNALNVLGVFILSLHLNWKEDQVLKAIKNFKGLKKRLEFRFKYKGAFLFEDFAHHPTAIQAGLSALREAYHEKRLIALFEPRSFTARSDFFQKEYIASFKQADLIFIARPYQSRKKEQQLCVQTLIKDLKKKGKKAFYYENFEQLEEEFKKQIKKEDIAVFMSSGAFGSLLEKLQAQSHVP